MKRTLIIITVVILATFLVVSFTRQINESFKQESTDPVLLRVKEKLRHMYPELDKLEFYESNKSYTTNKQKVHLCLKDRNGGYYSENMLMYVALHELAHVMCDEVGHTEKFYSIFQRLLDKAHDMGIYDPSIPIVKDYCEH
jgi:hypothetical protein